MIQVLTLLQHGPYAGQKATAGNLGFGIGGKLEIETGECAQFSVYHLMELDTGDECPVFAEEASSAEGGLLRGVVQTIGRGQPVYSDAEFRSTIALLQQKLSKPSGFNIYAAAGPSKSQPSKKPPRTLSDLCLVLRSKNAGPYEITLDAIFDSEASYKTIKDSNLLTRDRLAKALDIAEEDIIWMGWYEPARAFKVTIPRVRAGKTTAAGGFMENDVHGAQEHLGLATLELPRSMMPLPARAFGTHNWSKLVALLAALGSVGAVSAARRLLSNKK